MLMKTLLSQASQGAMRLLLIWLTVASRLHSSNLLRTIKTLQVPGAKKENGTCDAQAVIRPLCRALKVA